MRFFLDNCVSPYHAKGLRGFAEAQKYEIVHLRDKFSGETPDVEWIGALAKAGDWVVISGDQRIMTSPAEQAAWHESKLTAFFFAGSWARDSYWKQAADLVRWWPDIVLAARQAPKGSGFLIQKNAKALKRIFPAD